MKLSVFGIEFHIEMLLIMLVLYMIIYLHVFCSCCKIDLRKEGMSSMSGQSIQPNNNLSHNYGNLNDDSLNNSISLKMKFSPKCCPNAYSSSNGCACFTNKEKSSFNSNTINGRFV